MEVKFEIPDYFKAVVGSKTTAELSVLFQMVLLNPSILNTVRGLEVDSVIALEYLTKILAVVEKRPSFITQVAANDSLPVAQDIPDVDFSSLLSNEGTDDCDDADMFGDLANFLEGG